MTAPTPHGPFQARERALILPWCALILPPAPANFGSFPSREPAAFSHLRPHLRQGFGGQEGYGGQARGGGG